MPKQTVIARVTDGLILCASTEWQEVGNYEKQAKEIVKKLSPSSPPLMQIDSPPNYFLYMIVGDVVYMTLCEKSYPRKLAYSFLQELAKEFDIEYGQQVAAAKRSYQCIKFGKNKKQSANRKQLMAAKYYTNRQFHHKNQ